MTFMTHRNPGRTSMSVIGREFSLKPQQRKDLQKMLRDENHPTTLALKALGVTYGSEGKGRGAKSYLLKTRNQKVAAHGYSSDPRAAVWAVRSSGKRQSIAFS